MFCYLGYSQFCTMCLVGLWRDFVYVCGLLWEVVWQRQWYIFTDSFILLLNNFVCVKLFHQLNKNILRQTSLPRIKPSLAIPLDTFQLPLNAQPFISGKEITRSFVVSMKVQSGYLCFSPQLWDMRITRTAQEEKTLWLELLPLLCSFLALETGRSESALCGREEMEVMKHKKS